MDKVLSNKPHAIYMRKWRPLNIEKIRNYDKKWLEKNNGYKAHYSNLYMFGGQRDSVLLRDNYSCVKCGMTQEEHKEKWDRDITIDHIDGQGKYSKEKNNSLDNLQTLCCSCHGRKDGIRNGGLPRDAKGRFRRK